MLDVLGAVHLNYEVFFLTEYSPLSFFSYCFGGKLAFRLNCFCFSLSIRKNPLFLPDISLKEGPVTLFYSYLLERYAIASLVFSSSLGHLR